MTDTRTRRIDHIAKNKRIIGFVYALMDYLIFALIMLIIFDLTFNTLGKWLSDALASGLSLIRQLLNIALLNADINPAFRDLIINGICPGVGSVLSFIPIIAVLFLLLGILQESGYMSKAAAIMDRPLRRLGLSGGCVIPLVTGFGCAVPAIMSAASLPSCPECTSYTAGRLRFPVSPCSQKTVTVRLIPFMSCSARLPVYAMFISCFFPDHRITALLGIYSAGILSAVCTAFIANSFRNPGFVSNRISEQHLQYHLPDMNAVLSLVSDNVKGFIKKAFTVIFTASVLVWYLQSYSFNMQPASDISESMLAILGKTVSPIFEPLGFGDWRAASAVIAGLSAKEAIISTFVVTSSMPNQSLFGTLTEIFTPLSAFSFMLFCLLYMPCIATLCAVRNVTGSWKESVYMPISHLIIAWCVSFAVYNVGTFIISLI